MNTVYELTKYSLSTYTISCCNQCFLSPNYVYSGTASISLIVFFCINELAKNKNCFINLIYLLNFLKFSFLLRTISHAKTSSIKKRIVMFGHFSRNRTNIMPYIYTLVNVFGYKQSSSCILICIIRKICCPLFITNTRYYNWCLF